MKEKELKLIYLKGDYYLIQEGNPKPGEYYIGFAVGLRGIGRGFFLKHFSDNSPSSKLGAICSGNHRIIASTKELEGVEYFLNREQVEDHLAHCIPANIEIKNREKLEAKKAATKFANENKLSNPEEKELLIETFMSGYNLSERSDKQFTYGDMMKAIKFGRQIPPLRQESNNSYKEEIENFMESLYMEKVVYHVSVDENIREGSVDEMDEEGNFTGVVKHRKYIYIDLIKLPIEE